VPARLRAGFEYAWRSERCGVVPANDTSQRITSHLRRVSVALLSPGHHRIAAMILHQRGERYEWRLHLRGVLGTPVADGRHPVRRVVHHRFCDLWGSAAGRRAARRARRILWGPHRELDPLTPKSRNARRMVMRTLLLNERAITGGLADVRPIEGRVVFRKHTCVPTHLALR
jgi:hypothetical protein